MTDCWSVFDDAVIALCHHANPQQPATSAEITIYRLVTQGTIEEQQFPKQDSILFNLNPSSI